jgi:hypothetical protein
MKRAKQDAIDCEALLKELPQLRSDLITAQADFHRAGFAEKAEIVARIAAFRSRIWFIERTCHSSLSPLSGYSLKIVGIEQTQGIQIFHSWGSSSTRSSGAQPDNSIQLVAGKETVLRVYVDCTAIPTISSLTGVLETRPFANGNGWGHTPLTPYNSPITPRRAADIDRGCVDHTLNFRIPASRCHGSLEIRVTVYDAAHPGETGYTAGLESQWLSFAEVPSPQIRLVRISCKDQAGNATIPAPTTQEFWATAEFVFKTFPFPGIMLRRDSEVSYDGNLSSLLEPGESGSGKSGTTDTVSNILNTLRKTEGFPEHVRYIALIPGSPANKTESLGRTSDEVIIVGPGDGLGLARALARSYGHTAQAPCGNPPEPDPSYPVYSGYPSGSIGEFGFDTANSVVCSPQTCYDFTSYCTPAWISPYTYEALMRLLQRH